jgi:hypothetical protein
MTAAVEVVHFLSPTMVALHSEFPTPCKSQDVGEPSGRPIQRPPAFRPQGAGTGEGEGEGEGEREALFVKFACMYGKYGVHVAAGSFVQLSR